MVPQARTIHRPDLRRPASPFRLKVEDNSILCHSRNRGKRSSRLTKLGAGQHFCKEGSSRYEEDSHPDSLDPYRLTSLTPFSTKLSPRCGASGDPPVLTKSNPANFFIPSSVSDSISRMYGTERKLVGSSGHALKASRRLEEVIGSVDGYMYSVE